MRCTTCGAVLAPDALRCTTCGAGARRGGALTVETEVERCPRCGYRGQGIPYFRRASHIGLLLGVGVFTWGLGGLVYWILRRKHRICPGCGLGWEHSRPVQGTVRLVDTEPGAFESLERTGRGGGGRGRKLRSTAEEGEPLPRAGLWRRVGGVVLALFGLFLMVVGIVEAEAATLITGSAFGLGGSAVFWWGREALRERRTAVVSRLQRRVLLLAREREGVLTVSDVAAELDLSIQAAEKVLIGMDDGFRVRSEITRDGLLLYEFPEFLPREGGRSDALPRGGAEG